MIFTSFFHHFSILDKIDYTKFNNLDFTLYKYKAMKSVEFSVVWYLYIRFFLGKNEDIFIVVPKNSPIKINYLLNLVDEPYEFVSDDDKIDDSVKLHIKEIEGDNGLVDGLRKLYFYIYKLAYRNNFDIFFLDNDCILSKNWLEECKKYEFATNVIDLKECCCDSYAKYISKNKLRELDFYIKFDVWIEHMEKICINFPPPDKDNIVHDPIGASLIERGVYSRFCFGNVLTFNNKNIIHNMPDHRLLDFLIQYPIKNDFIISFIKNVKRRIKKEKQWRL